MFHAGNAGLPCMRHRFEIGRGIKTDPRVSRVSFSSPRGHAGPTRYWHETSAVAMDDPNTPEPPDVTEQKLAAG